ACRRRLRLDGMSEAPMSSRLDVSAETSSDDSAPPHGGCCTKPVESHFVVEVDNTSRSRQARSLGGGARWPGEGCYRRSSQAGVKPRSRFLRQRPFVQQPPWNARAGGCVTKSLHTSPFVTHPLVRLACATDE